MRVFSQQAPGAQTHSRPGAALLTGDQNTMSVCLNVPLTKGSALAHVQFKLCSCQFQLAQTQFNLAQAQDESTPRTAPLKCDLVSIGTFKMTRFMSSGLMIQVMLSRGGAHLGDEG